MKRFGFSERLDSGQLAFAQNARGLHVFINQSFDGKHELIMKRRHGFFGQAAHVELERVGAAVEAAHQFSAEDRGHAGRQAAIGSQPDAFLLRLFCEREFLADDGVVAAQIREVASGGDGGFGQTEVQAVRNGGERSIMAIHQSRRFFFFRGVERDGSNFSVAGDAVDACRNILRALAIAIGECYGVDVVLTGHVISSGGSHHSGTDDEQFHKCSLSRIFRPCDVEVNQMTDQATGRRCNAK